MISAANILDARQGSEYASALCIDDTLNYNVRYHNFRFYGLSKSQRFHYPVKNSVSHDGSIVHRFKNLVPTLALYTNFATT